MGEPQVFASMRFRHGGVQLGKALDMSLVKQGTAIGNTWLGGTFPVKRIVNDDALAYHLLAIAFVEIITPHQRSI